MTPTCTIGAVGDIVLAGSTAERLRADGPGWLFERVRPALDRADVLFGNLECVIVPPGGSGDSTLVTDFDGSAALDGFDVLSLANNHILDAGTRGLEHTRAVIEARGIAVSGVGSTQAEARRLVVVERNGLRIGFLSYGEDSNYTLSSAGPGYAYYEPDTVLADLASAREQVDVVVVSIHADLEFRETPSVPRRDAFRAFAQAGATLVLGHHPHVPQGIERVGAGLVAYSLGNFAFNVHTSAYLRPRLPAVARSFVLLVEVSTSGVESFSRVPVLIAPRPDERPVLVDGAAAPVLEAELARLDRLAADDAVVAANWRTAALEQLLRRLPPSVAQAGPDRILHALGSLLHVAENRAWVDEVGRAVEEAWDLQRAHTDEHHRPSFAAPKLPQERASLAHRVAARIRRNL